MTSRRGFTLIELMVALVLTLMVSGVTYRVLNTNQRLSRAQTERAGLQDNVRSGSLVMANELREVGYDQVPVAPPAVLAATGLLPVGVLSDIVAMGPDSIRYNAMRGFGVTCGVDGATGRITLRNSGGATNPLLQFLRMPVVNSDKIVIYVEGDPSIQADDLWLHGTITGYTANQNCPDGTAGSSVIVDLDNGLDETLAYGQMKLGGPVRIYEQMLMRSYVSGGQTWLGMRSVSAGGVIQPVIGPLSGTAGLVTGLALSYRDVNNNVTAVAANVRSIQVTMRGVSDGSIRKNGTGYAAVDTMQIVSQVALRNTLR